MHRALSFDKTLASNDRWRPLGVVGIWRTQAAHTTRCQACTPVSWLDEAQPSPRSQRRSGRASSATDCSLPVLGALLLAKEFHRLAPAFYCKMPPKKRGHPSPAYGSPSADIPGSPKRIDQRASPAAPTQVTPDKVRTKCRVRARPRSSAAPALSRPLPPAVRSRAPNPHRGRPTD